jgi:hypothetical protein
MSIAHVVTRGFGNGTLLGDRNLIALRGFTSNKAGTASVLTELLNDVTLRGLIGDRIYRVKFPDNIAYPAILYRASEESINTLGGKSSYVKKRYEFELYAYDFSTLEAISNQVINALRIAPFQALLIDKSDEDYADELGIFSIFLEFSIWQ